jgi:hypothetical protein
MVVDIRLGAYSNLNILRTSPRQQAVRQHPGVPDASALNWSTELPDNPNDAAVPAFAPYTMLFLRQVSSTLNCPRNRSRVRCPGWPPG